MWVLLLRTSEHKTLCSVGGRGVATIKGKDFATADYSGGNAKMLDALFLSLGYEVFVCPHDIHVCFQEELLLVQYMVL